MKKIILCICLGLTQILGAVQTPKVLMVLNEGYRPVEYASPRKQFEANGFEVKVAGYYPGHILPSRKDNGEVPPVNVDVTFDKVSVADYDAVVFVGGNGAWDEFLPSITVQKILFDSMRKKKITALLSVATGLLAMAGNFDGDHPRFSGRHVTGYFEVEGILKHVGRLNYDWGDSEKPYVVVDGNLITGRDPLSANLFGETVVKAIKSIKR